jgi:hypothetical protein
LTEERRAHAVALMEAGIAFDMAAAIHMATDPNSEEDGSDGTF